MNWEPYTYALLHVFTVSFPILRSFEHRIYFFQYWPSILLGAAAASCIFIPWDIWFTAEGVWSFNEAYFLGIRLAHLPIEEWLFFFTVPFACVFIYEVLRYFFPSFAYRSFHKGLMYFYILVFMVLAIGFEDRLYTHVNFTVAALVTGFHLGLMDTKVYPHFHLTHLVAILPFLIVNGVLTSLPIVSYNDAENLGIRLGTIPIEDIFYNYSLLLITITVHEKTKAFFISSKGNKSHL